MKRLIITTVDSTPHYQEGTKVFLASLAENAPKEDVLVYLINCSEEYKMSLYSINPRLDTIFTGTTEASPLIRNYIRHVVILDEIKEYNKVAWLDNDAIIRGPLDGLWEGVEGDTLKIWYRKKKKDHLKFQGGVYVVGGGEKTENWLRLINEKLTLCSDWYSPQTLIYACFKEVGLKHIQLDPKYNDSKFKDDSIIWHCKSSHFDNPKYQKEYRSYLEKI
jgi:hypothetical protein